MKSLVARIKKLYGLELHSPERVAKGFLSENHILLGDGTKYFLKRYRFDSKDRIQEIHVAKRYFADGGIPVILPIVNKESSTFFFCDGGYFALFPFVIGWQPERGSLSDIAVESLGETLGRIHLLGRDADVPIKERFKPWDKQEALERIKVIDSEIKKKSELTDFDKLALESIIAKKRLMEANLAVYEDFDLPADHLIHGDYLDHNVFFGTDDHVSHVFDLEKTEYSPRMFELFRSLMYTFVSGRAGLGEMEKVKRYLGAYRKVYPTRDDELSSGLKLFYLKVIHGTWIESEHYLRNNMRIDHFFLGDFRRMSYLADHLKEFENEILRS